MKPAGPVRPQLRLHAGEHPLHRLRPLIRPQRAGVQVAEVHAGDETLMDLAQPQHLVQISQLVDLPHGLGTQGDVSEPLVLTHRHDVLQKGQGDGHGLLPGALHQCPGVDHHPGGPHLIGHQTGRGDIAQGFLLGLGVRVGQIDEIGGVEGERNAVCLGLPPQGHGGVLLHPHPFPALIFIAVQPQLLQPPGRIHRGLVGETHGIARRSEFCTHRLSPPGDSSRKGTSMA